MDNKSLKNWIIFAVAILVIGTGAYLFSQPINHYVVGATQGSGFSRAYLKMFYRINKDTRINGQTPIQYALLSAGKLNEGKKQNLMPVIDYFLAKGVDINEISEYGMTALHYAVDHEDPIAVQMIIEKKADVNKPIHFENLDEPLKVNPTEGMTPLKFLDYLRKQKKTKTSPNLDLIEKQLVAAGAHA